MPDFSRTRTARPSSCHAGFQAHPDTDNHFYPKDDAWLPKGSLLRGFLRRIQDAGVQVVGISSDDVTPQEVREKYKLPFTLLSDTKGEMRKLFGVPKTVLTVPGRVTTVLDNKGKVGAVREFHAAAGTPSTWKKAMAAIKKLKHKSP